MIWIDLIKTFKLKQFSSIVDILADLYQKGDQKCTYEPKKILKVTPAPMLFELTNGAKQLFKGVYNDFEQLSQDKANCCLEEGIKIRFYLN